MKRNILYIMLFFGIIIMTSCEKPNSQSETKSESKNRIKIVEEESNVDFVLEHMSIEEKVGQMVIAGIQEDVITEETKSFFRENHIGGVILFSRNTRSNERLKKFNSDIASVNERIPLFISVDEEGGRVSRLPQGKVKIPPNYVVATQNEPEIFYDIGRVISDELLSYGFNTDFAPVMDVWSNPKNSIIGDRAFSSDPNKVAKCGERMIAGFKSKGIISVIKHFPGHGDTLVDSHKGLPTVNNSLEQLREREFIPFQEAIDNGVDGIMVGHLLMSQLEENKHPASLSKRIVTDLLREEMGYEGVIFSDDMEMGAILKNYNMEEAAVLAVEAGIDVLLICHSRSNIKAALGEIIQEVKSGKISLERIDESVKRILKLKEEYNIVNLKEWRDTYEEKDNN